MTDHPTAADIIRLLDLKPHPEGGYFRETFRDARRVQGGRAASTAIYFLLSRGERSHWHRIDAVEVWHWHAGAPLRLEIAQATGRIESVALGGSIAAGERPQAIVPARAWQAAYSLGAWTLCGCTVAPGFEFSGFERRLNGSRSEFAFRAGAIYTKYCPPLAVNVEPVIKPASSEARNTTQRAISSGSPRRPIGMVGRILFSRTSFATACTISVLI